MTNIQIIQSDFEQKLKLLFATGIKAGFPSPAEDYNHDTLDFNRDLIRNPEATFYGKRKANVFARSAQMDACLSKNAIKHDFKSRNPTARWSDIIRLK